MVRLWRVVVLLVVMSVEGSSTMEPEDEGQCGILWFLHIGKTGGTTVMSYMSDEAAKHDLRYVDFFSWDVPHWEWETSDCLKEIKAEVFGKDKPRLVVNHHHGTPGMTPEFIRDHLQPLACAAYAKGCTFTLTTLLRQPVSHLRSFNVYKHHLQKERGELAQFDNFDFPKSLQECIYDFQATYIEHGSKATDITINNGASLAYVTKVLRENFSLVGFTETLNEFLEDSFEMSFGIKFDGGVKTTIRNKSPVGGMYAAAFNDEFLDAVAPCVTKDSLLYIDFKTTQQKTTQPRFECPQNP